VKTILLIIPFDGHRQASPTLGAGYIKAYADRYSGNRVHLHDENFAEDRDAFLLQKMEEIMPDFVGISFPSSAVLRVAALARLLKERYPDTPVFAGGYHPTSEPELTLRLIPGVDFVARGEGEAFVASLSANWRDLPNAAWLEDGIYKENPVEAITDIDTIPFPDRRIYDRRYFLPQEGVIAGVFGRTATLMSSRGCPYSCRFCSGKMMQKAVRCHSAGRVLDEIEHLLTVRGEIDYLYFLDVMFLARWDRVEELCRELIRNRFHRRFRWAATVAANVVDEEKVRLMKEAGCFYLSFGFESDSPRVLSIINKRATPQQNRKACEICEKLGIHINSAFLFGIPGEREEDLDLSIEFVKRHNIGFTGVNIMRPLPGSPFYREFVKEGRIVPSLEEWHEISSIYEARKIFNDGIPPDVYGAYIGRFNEAARWKGRYNRMRANWRMRLKYLFDRPQVA